MGLQAGLYALQDHFGLGPVDKVGRLSPRYLANRWSSILQTRNTNIFAQVWSPERIVVGIPVGINLWAFNRQVPMQSIRGKCHRHLLGPEEHLITLSQIAFMQVLEHARAVWTAKHAAHLLAAHLDVVLLITVEFDQAEFGFFPMDTVL